MMFSRLDIRPVLRGHWKVLVRADKKGRPADYGSRAVVVVSPMVVGVVVWVLDGKFAAPAALLTATALLMGGFLTVFGAISTLRLKLTDWDESSKDRGDDRRNLDESAAHIATAALACLANAVLLVVSMNTTTCPTGAVVGVWAGAVAAMSSYVSILFLITVVRLYSAYVEVNKVADESNGYVRKGRIRF